MFNIKDHVMYGDNGVCQIVDKRKEKIAGQFGEYYILQPVDNASSTFYVPANNERLVSKMRPIMSKEAVMELLTMAAKEDMDWDEDNRVRQTVYKEVFERGDSKELLLLLKALYRQREERREEGKRLWAIDENAMKHVEKLVCEEFAAALGQGSEETLSYILEQIKV